MKTAAIVAMSRFPYWRYTLTKLAEVVDDIYINFDKKEGDPEIIRFAHDVLGGKLACVRVTNQEWRCPDWREDCLSILDDVPDEDLPDIVLTPDQDEVFGDDIKEDIKNLFYSDKNSMSFEYEPLMSNDGRVINAGVPYPPDPHIKAFKYKRGLSYFPYHGDGRIAQYYDSIIAGKSKIKHYAAYTQKMQDAKKWRSHTPIEKAMKAVTLIGFGPSAKKTMECIGEIWTLNNGYDVLCEDAWKRTTRVYEMHIRSKREKEVGRDGKPHLWHLSRCGKDRRIIMQQSWDDIKGSEAYPLYDVIESTGLDWFAGSPCYMLAQAIHEGFTHIRIYGLDQLDWEHTLQRECFGAWVCFAKGRGIKVDGALTFLEKYTKRYGYDYAPEFCEYQQELMWSGWPFEIKMKIPSRVVDGKLYDGVK